MDDLPEKDCPILDVPGLKAVLLIPLFVSSQFEGFLGFENHHDVNPWQSAEVNLLSSVADSLSKAIGYANPPDEFGESGT